MTRQQANFHIISILAAYLAENPDIRFQQALWSLDLIRRDSEGGFIDDFNEESIDTLRGLKELK